MRLRSLTYDELVANHVSGPFARILSDPDSYHPDLSIHIGKTNWDYHIPDGVSNVVPLWDSNADSFVRWNRNGNVEFVWLYHDDPNWSLMAKSEQGIMAILFHEWAEFQESDEDCQQFADAMGFRYCEEALKMMENDSDTIKRWRLSLVD